jgi:outer membrane protein TolC
MTLKKLLFSALLFALALQATSQEVLSLDTCRARALRANTSIKQAEAKVDQTHALERAALMQVLPKVSANGGYMWMEKSVNLLSEEQKDRINHIGDNMEGNIRQALHNELDDVPVMGSTLADRLGDAVANSGAVDHLNELGNEIVQGMETDTRNLSGALITLSQPIYTGGKLLALHRTAALSYSLAGLELTKKQQETLVAVDEAYWQVVSVQNKKALAEQYETLLDTLENHVTLLVEAEMATKGDLANVRVKHNEARLNLTKATNGLRLSKMLLAQRCGMSLDSDFEVESEKWEAESAADSSFNIHHSSLDDVYSRRSELKMLRIADSMAREGVRIASSALKPNIAVSGGYLFTNPNLFDGFKNEWGGTWTAGVVVNIPIVHPAGIYAVKAAKAKRREVAYQMQEAEELIAMQVNKLDCELELAYRHLDEAESTLDAAEENLHLADESFKAGMCSTSDLMAAQTAWMKAKSEVLDTRIEIEMGKLYLNKAIGN